MQKIRYETETNKPEHHKVELTEQNLSHFHVRGLVIMVIIFDKKHPIYKHRKTAETCDDMSCPLLRMMQSNSEM